MPRQRSSTWGGARGNRSALARPTVRRVVLSDAAAAIAKNAVIVRYGAYSAQEVSEWVSKVIEELGRTSDDA